MCDVNSSTGIQLSTSIRPGDVRLGEVNLTIKSRWPLPRGHRDHIIMNEKLLKENKHHFLLPYLTEITIFFFFIMVAKKRRKITPSSISQAVASNISPTSGMFLPLERNPRVYKKNLYILMYKHSV